MGTVIYLRQSQDRAGTQYGVERQREDGRTLARLRGLSIIDELTDNDLTASGKRKRPGFEAVIEALESGRAKAVIAWDMSRLSRNARDTLRLLEAGQKAGAVLLFVRGSELNLATADGRTMAGILSSIAQGEIDKKSERQLRAAEQAAAQGRRTSGRRAFGYGVQVGEDPATGKPIIDYDQLHPVEAPALRDAYHQSLSGMTLTAIARSINEQGLFPPQGTRDGRPSVWTLQNLGPVMLNPRNAGLRSHVTTDLLDRLHPVKARIAGIVGPAAWPAVIDEPTWRVYVAKATNTPRGRKGPSPQRFLTGTALCGVCDATVHGWKNGLGQPAYRCSAAYGHLGRRSEPVDAYVEEFMEEFLSSPHAQAELCASGGGVDVVALRAEMRSVREKLNEQAALHAAEVIDTAQLRAGSAVLRQKLNELEHQMASAGGDSVLAALVEADDKVGVWRSLGIERRRAVVNRLFTVRLIPPGQGSWKFRPETVQIERREKGS